MYPSMLAPIETDLGLNELDCRRSGLLSTSNPIDASSGNAARSAVGNALCLRSPVSIA